MSNGPLREAKVPSVLFTFQSLSGEQVVLVFWQSADLHRNSSRLKLYSRDSRVYDNTSTLDYTHQALINQNWAGPLRYIDLAPLVPISAPFNLSCRQEDILIGKHDYRLFIYDFIVAFLIMVVIRPQPLKYTKAHLV